MPWFCYVAQCQDKSLYTGITTDIVRRQLEHNTSKTLGAKSLRGKRPIKIIYFEEYQFQTAARKREVEIKGWTRKKKLNLIKKGLP